MINGIGVRNLRSFKNSTNIELKPITVFVGKNSSGKSSLLRTFPLFRQSVEENTTGPILWYGRYVDFGDFDEIKSNGSLNNDIEFNFDITLNEISQRLYSPARYWAQPYPDLRLNIKLIVHSKDRKTKTKQVEIKHSDFIITIILDENDAAKLIINTKEHSIEREGLIARNLGQFIPQLSLKKSKEEQLSFAGKRFHYGQSDKALENNFLESATKSIQSKFHNKTDPNLINTGLARVGLLPLDHAKSIINTIFREQKTFSKHFLIEGSSIVSDVYPFLIGCNFNILAEIANRTLISTFNNIKYIAPLRATSERYYRFQDLQINEIDHTGSNLAMLLNSLKPQEKMRFEEWTRNNFDFIVKVKQVGSHFAVIISTNSKDEFNISDMGFGYSQVLPIVTAVWLETERSKSYLKPSITFIIEQPELHLHPSYQYTLAKTFAKVVAKAKKSDNIDLKIIFETHSQSMIEALGECIEDDSIALTSDDVSVLVFEKDDENSTQVTTSYFDDGGMLMNWPIGFFSGR